MKKLEWNKSMSVDVPSLDQEHGRIISMINELINDIATKDTNNLTHILYDLDEYVREHFSHEERLMEDYNYKYIVTHKLMHQQFIEKIEEFSKQLKGEALAKEELSKADGGKVVKRNKGSDAPKEMKLVIASDIARFLFDWLVNHIMTHDKKYASLFKSGGVR